MFFELGEPILKCNILFFNSTSSKNIYTPETPFSEPQFSEILNLMNKLPAPFFKFHFLVFVQTLFS